MIDPELEEARLKWEEVFNPGITQKRLEAKAYQEAIKQELQRLEDQISNLRSPGYLPPEKETPKKKSWVQKFIEWQWK